MKSPRERLQLSTYPFTTEIEPRFGDVDALQHLNNVALAGIYEEARLRFTATFRHAPQGEDGQRPVLAQITIRYLAEGHYPGTLTAGIGALHIGRTSYVVGQALFQAGACIGTADTVIVWTAEGRPHPVPDPFRAALEAAHRAARFRRFLKEDRPYARSRHRLHRPHPDRQGVPRRLEQYAVADARGLRPAACRRARRHRTGRSRGCRHGVRPPAGLAGDQHRSPGGVARRHADHRAGHEHRPAVRLGPDGGGDRRQADRHRWHADRDRRRCRVDQPGAERAFQHLPRQRPVARGGTCRRPI